MYCILLLSYVLMAADRYLFPVIAPYVRREFGFSPALTGLLTTIFTLGLGVGGLTTGYILARLSRESVMLVGIAIFSGATALTSVIAWILGHALVPRGARNRDGHAGHFDVCAGGKLFRDVQGGGNRVGQFLLRNRRIRGIVAGRRAADEVWQTGARR